MSVHFQIYKNNPKTQERVVLHEMVPQAIADWLRDQSEGELSAKEKAQGAVVLKEPAARGVPRSPSRAEVAVSPSKERKKPLRKHSMQRASKRKAHRRAR